MSDLTFKFELGYTSLKLLNKAVKKYLEKWPGGSPVEQEAVKAMCYEIDKAMLDASFMLDTDA